MGLSISEVIQKEHFDIALKKVSIGNSIISINTITYYKINKFFFFFLYKSQKKAENSDLFIIK